MYRALLVKELRECLPLVAVASLLAAWVLHVWTGGAPWPGEMGRAPKTPFVTDNFHTGPLLLIVGGLALLLGLKQTAWEELRGTYHYLLHRPVARTRVFLLKIAVGLAVVQILGAAMILVYALWAATPGTHPSPFFWSMTLPAWQVWAAAPAIYLAAFLCGMRPARWYGSKLLPLVACGAAASLLIVQPYMWITVTGTLVLAALSLPAAIDVVQTRDY
jgi:hypothetical protein